MIQELALNNKHRSRWEASMLGLQSKYSSMHLHAYLGVITCFISSIKGLPESKLKAFQMGRNPLKGKAPSKVKEEEKKKVHIFLVILSCDVGIFQSK